jgi:hypothetical protein
MILFLMSTRRYQHTYLYLLTILSREPLSTTDDERDAIFIARSIEYKYHKDKKKLAIFIQETLYNLHIIGSY